MNRHDTTHICVTRPKWVFLKHQIMLHTLCQYYTGTWHHQVFIRHGISSMSHNWVFVFLIINFNHLLYTNIKNIMYKYISCNNSEHDSLSLQWCQNGHSGVSNHQPHNCLLNSLFRRISKKTSKLHVTGLFAVNSPHKWPVTQKMFPFDVVIM